MRVEQKDACACLSVNRVDQTSGMTGNSSFPRQARLLQPTQFSAVLLRRCYRKGHFVQVYVLKTEYCSARLGIIVAKRDLHRSVDRNFAKRLVRETFRTQRSTLPPLDYVVRIIKPISSPEAAAMRHELENLLVKPRSCID